MKGFYFFSKKRLPQPFVGRVHSSSRFDRSRADSVNENVSEMICASWWNLQQATLGSQSYCKRMANNLPMNAGTIAPTSWTHRPVALPLGNVPPRFVARLTTSKHFRKLSLQADGEHVEFRITRGVRERLSQRFKHSLVFPVALGNLSRGSWCACAGLWSRCRIELCWCI